MTIAFTQLSARAAGYNVTDCEVRDRGVLYLLAREDYTQRPNWRDTMEPPPDGKLAKRILGLRLDVPDERKWGHAHLTGLDLSFCSMAFEPEAKIVVVDIGTKAWAQHASANGFEPELKSRAQGGINRGAVTRARCFGHQQLICNTARQLFKRIGPGQWMLIGEPIEKTTGEFTGFADFDQCANEDIYAVGGEGDIWHFNGTQWRQCAFPTDWGLSAVCCAGDGQVYVCAGAGAVYRGIGDRWKLIHNGDYTLPFKDMVWYDDKVWCTSDYGLWTIEGDTLTEANVPSGVKLCAGNLATRDGVLLVAGYGGAAFKRDGEWTVIYHDHELRELAANRK